MIATLAFSIATNSTALAEDVTITDLNRINEDIRLGRDSGNTYFLGANLDLANVTPIGPTLTYVTGPFTGVFNGNGFIISNLRAPLFDVIGDGTSTGGVENLGLKTTSEGIVGDASYNQVGVLAGTLGTGSFINRVAVTGSITTISEDVAGGLVGVAEGNTSISNSSSSVSITTSPGASLFLGVVGGLVGRQNGGVITNSSASGVVTNLGGSGNTGGLIGFAEFGQVLHSTASGAVYSSNSFTGGLIGNANYVRITNSSSSGSVTVVDTQGAIESVGGLLGYANATDVLNSWSSADVTVSAVGPIKNVGGLVGYGEVSVGQGVTNSLASGSVAVTTSSSAQNIGGLAGSYYSSVSNSWSSADVTVSAVGLIENVGGLVGYGWQGVTNSLASGSLTVTTDDVAQSIGGLAGSIYSVSNSLSSADLTVSAVGRIENVGGLVGSGWQDVKNSLASGSVTVTTSSSAQNIGGLAGRNNSSVLDSLSSADVTVSADGQVTTVGGLVGNGWSVTNSLASGSVTVTTSSSAQNIGGLAGYSAFILDSLSSAEITVSTDGLIENVGGLVGYGWQGVTNSLASGSLTVTTDDVAQNIGGLTGNDPMLNLDSIYFGDVSVVSPHDVFLSGTAWYRSFSGSFLQGPTGPVGPISVPGNGVYTLADIDLLNTDTSPSTWGQDQYINEGLPYILALRENGFYSKKAPEIASEYTPVINLVNSRVDNTGFLSPGMRLFQFLTGGNQIEISVAEFNLLGASGVNNANLPIVLKLLKMTEVSSINLNTINENIKLANLVLKKEIRLFRFLAGDSSTMISISDFREIGVYGVTSANLPHVLKLLKEKSWESLTSKTIGKLVRKAEITLRMNSLSFNKNNRK